MKFSMLKITGWRDRRGDYKLESTLMEMGGSTPWKCSFESQHDVLSIISTIAARQKGNPDIRYMLGKAHEGEHYLFDVDLSEEQAECLGWTRSR